jgi:two-component SAPR family response regulator
VIEDELLVAMQLSRMIRDLGGEVVGPLSSVGAAEELLTNSEVDGAVVDLWLGGETSASLAEALLTRGVPMILTTGYAEDLLPHRLTQAPRLSKPYTKSDFEEIAKRHFVSKSDRPFRTEAGKSRT